MNSFQFQTAEKIVVGQHMAEQLPSYLEPFGRIKSALILSQPSMKRLGYLDVLLNGLKAKGISCQLITNIPSEPTEEQLNNTYSLIKDESFDLIIGVGGGSVLDAAKILSVMFTNRASIRDMLGSNLVQHTGIPLILIPTTSGTGSEVTPNAIVTLPEEELKLAIVSPFLYPKLVILDPVLTLSLPQAITAATGMDAFTHALESYISNKANPMSNMLALESIRYISSSIEDAYYNGDSIQARERMLIGSMYGGMALSCSGTAAVHAMAYPLGGVFHITHGVANSMLLPHVMAFNFDAIQEQLSQVAAAMMLPEAQNESRLRTAEAVIQQIIAWTHKLNIPQNLTAYGVREEHLESLALGASKVTRLLNNNPKPVTLNDMKVIYKKILH